MTKHTQGPWKLAGPTTVSNSDQSVGIANVCTYSIEEGEAAANGRLIAASPDLLEALQMVDRIWSHDQTVNLDPESPVAQIRAAIAKATGEIK